MEIKQGEIESIEDVGEMDGSPVKMIRTKGGLVVFCGTPKNKGTTVLAAGSHPAICRHSAQKAFPNFHPHLMKSESAEQEQVSELTQYLNPKVSQAGYDLYSLKKANTVEYVLTHFGTEQASVKALLKNDSLVVFSCSEIPELLEIASTLRQVAARDAVEHQKDFLTLNGRKFKAKEVF